MVRHNWYWLFKLLLILLRLHLVVARLRTWLLGDTNDIAIIIVSTIVDMMAVARRFRLEQV